MIFVPLLFVDLWKISLRYGMKCSKMKNKYLSDVE